MDHDDNDYTNSNCIFLLHNLYLLFNKNIDPMYISINKNIFSSDECNEIVNYAYANTLKNENNSSSNYIFPNKTTNYIYNRLRQLVNKLNNEFWNYNLIDFGEPLKFIEYNSINEGKISFHSDIGGSMKTNFRKLTIIIQLSNINNYEGGELNIYNPNKNIIPKEQGTVIIFPSFLIHNVNKVTKGIRNSIVIFAHGMPLM